jgi:predicted transcriptional regulator
MTIFTVQIPNETARKLNLIADAFNASTKDITAELIENYVRDNEYLVMEGEYENAVY